jgi:hypothetical protein
VDVAEPPRIVVESRASCASAERDEELLHDALGAARAPGHAWTVTMRVQPTAEHALHAEGEITDGLGLRVAARLLSVPAGDCRGLARAVGVWASLVLEQELARRHSVVGGSPSSIGTASNSAAPSIASPGPIPATNAALSTTESQSTDSLWPAPAVLEKRVPEGEWYLHHEHEDKRTLELGVAGFLMSGAGAGAMAGASPYAIIEAGHGVFLRPALALGETITALNSPPITNAMWIAGRFDACLRVPGLYTQNRGIQLDLCGGADFGFLDDSTDNETLPFVSVGPSLDLRGDLGSSLAAAIRAVTGLNVTSETQGPVYQPLWSGRLELAFSWKVQ